MEVAETGCWDLACTGKKLSTSNVHTNRPKKRRFVWARMKESKLLLYIDLVEKGSIHYTV